MARRLDGSGSRFQWKEEIGKSRALLFNPLVAQPFVDNLSFPPLVLQPLFPTGLTYASELRLYVGFDGFVGHASNFYVPPKEREREREREREKNKIKMFMFNHCAPGRVLRELGVSAKFHTYILWWLIPAPKK